MAKPARAMAQHSSASPSWGTPQLVVQLARKVLGRIDLDPFTDKVWNEAIGATSIINDYDDAFDCEWITAQSPRAATILHGSAPYPTDVPAPAWTALVNPPGDPRGESVKKAWRLTEWHWRTGWLGGGVLYVVFNVNNLQSLQGVAPRSPLHRDFLRCIPCRRVRYESSPGVVGDCPPHASALVLLPAHGPQGAYQRAVFEGLASELGEVF